MKTIKNRSGFSSVELLLVVVIVGIVGFVGWYVWQANKDDSKSTANTQTSTTQKTNKEETSEEVQKDETESWTSFTPNSKFYSIKLPDGWTFLHQKDECDCLYSETTVLKAGTPATVETSPGPRDGITGYFIAVDEDDKSAARFEDFQNQGTIKVGDLEGTKYYYEQTTEAEGIGLEKGSKQYAYYFVKDDKRIYISYSFGPNETNNIDIVEKSINTLK